MINYPNLIQAIQTMYPTLGDDEKEFFRIVLEEISQQGRSPSYESIWYEDYTEIPVDKMTFLTSDEYLGRSNNEGEAIYPVWKDVLKELEIAGNQYTEIIFTGATRTGKTSTAVSDACYQLYRLMCLKDPQSYFGLKSVTRISIFFFNLTEALAKGVAFKEFITTLSVSPWFQQHGHFTASENNPTYVPDGGQIEITYGSDASHALGKATYCVTGDTQIVTDCGLYRIDELVDQVVEVLQYDTYAHKFEFGCAYVMQTGFTNSIIQVELENGSCIKGTPEHRVLLADMTYRELKDVGLNDWVYSIQSLDMPFGTCSKVDRIEHIVHDEPYPVYDVVNACKHHNFVMYSNSNHIVLHNCVIFDEVNFAQAGIKDVSKAKARMKEKYDTLVARVTGTFVKNGEVFGKIYVISSKRSDSDFMEEYIAAQQKAGNPHMYIFDKPQWEVWPASKYSSPARFHIALGGKNLRSFVVPDNQENPESLAALESQGYRLLQVPMDNKVRFLSDFDVALRDIAGISVPGTLSFITQEVLLSCITHERRNPFYTDVVSVGTKDSLTLEEFFHLEEVPKHLLKCPMFIHLDLSLNTDKSGIGCVAITGRKDVEGQDGKTISYPTFEHIFSVSVEAPRGDKIPYHKITEFLCWLRRSGFNIDRISRDQFQSEYMAQLLESQGFTVDKVSLDRTPDGYITLRSMLLEGRIQLLDVQLLQDELIRLQRDPITGKVDHPVGGSKDMADGFAGALWNASTHDGGIIVPTKTVANVISKVNGSRSMNNGRPSLPSMFPNLNPNLRKR